MRWRAARVRINHLLSSALKPDEKVAKKKTAKATEKSADLVIATTKIDPTEDEKGAHDTQKPTRDAKPEKDVVTAAEKSDNKQEEKHGRSAEDAVRTKPEQTT